MGERGIRSGEDDSRQEGHGAMAAEQARSHYMYATLTRVKNTNLFYFTFEDDPKKVNEANEESNSGLGRLSLLLTNLSKEGWEPVLNTTLGDFTGNLQETLILRKTVQS